MHKKILLAAAVFGALGVALGAFGAHGLQRLTGDPAILNSYDTAARYQLLHAVALLALASLAASQPSRIWNWAAAAFVVGILLFSGSLYLITFFRIREMENLGILGPLTPFGGVFLITGWVLLAFGVAGRAGGRKSPIDRGE